VTHGSGFELLDGNVLSVPGVNSAEGEVKVVPTASADPFSLKASEGFRQVDGCHPALRHGRLEILTGPRIDRP
jgi:hypothetical protein